MSVYLFIKFKEADFFLSILRLSISKSSLSQVGILIFLANEKKIASNNLATNLAFLGTCQILPLRRAYMRARKCFGIAVSVVSRLSGGGARTDMAAASSSTSRSLLLYLVADDAGFTRVRLTESQSAIAAAVLQLAMELPFPTLLLPS